MIDKGVCAYPTAETTKLCICVSRNWEEVAICIAEKMT